MRRRSAFLIIAGLGLALTACSPQPPASTSPAPGPSVAAGSPALPPASVATGAPDLGGRREAFARSGLKVGAYAPDATKLDKDAKPLFAGAGHSWDLEVGGSVVSVDPYPTSAQASRVVAGIDRARPFPLVEFAGIPHVFSHGRAIVMFVERTSRLGPGAAAAPTDARILPVLRSEFGTDYAEAP